MSSAMEQLASNLNWDSFLKAKDLHKRIWFTLGALIVYRLGSYIPLPGIDTFVMGDLVNQHSGGLLSIIDRFTGGALGRMSVFALGVMPYISASIIIQLLTVVYPYLDSLKKEGNSGRITLNQYTRYGTVVLSILQSYGIATGLESMVSISGSAVMDPGFMFRFVSVITLTGGVIFLMWLGEQITSRGIGNGISLLIFAGIVSSLPKAFAAMFDLGRTTFSALFMAMVLLSLVLMIFFIVFMERAQRRVVVQYPKRQIGNKMFGGDRSHMPIKINVSGVIPPIFASSLLTLPSTIVNFSGESDGFFGKILFYLGPQHPFYLTIYISLIIFFSFFYTSIVFNPQETSDNLRKNGGFVPGYRPGADTSSYFDYLLTRLTVVGSIYLAFICVLPEVFISKYSLPFALGGTSFLIVVSVSIDTVTQIHSHLLSHQYGGLVDKMKSGRSGSKRRNRRERFK